MSKDIISDEIESVDDNHSTGSAGEDNLEVNSYVHSNAAMIMQAKACKLSGLTLREAYSIDEGENL